MSFFIKKKGRGGKGKTPSGFSQKRKVQTSEKSQPQKKKFKTKLEEEIDSDSEIDSEGESPVQSSSEEEETAQEKKLRLAKKYLAELETQERAKRDDEDDDEEIDSDAISKRLQLDQLEQSGKLQTRATVEPPSPEEFILFRGHQLSVTCVVISPDNQFVYSASKDCSIIKWSLKEKRRVRTIHGGRKGTEDKHVGHTSHILALALSSDGKYLASGDVNKLIHIWDGDGLELVHTFKGHRQAVSGLTFRKDTHQLYSCSHDRSVKIWNVDERAYVETLFGHEDKITAIDSLTRERAITAGGRDSSIRVWKIIEESQLVFNAHTSCSIDCVALLNEQTFVSGTDDNSISIWSVMKKKPTFTVRNAHSSHRQGSEGTLESTATKFEENWITSVAALHNSDLIASAGSKDGSIRLWKCRSDHKKLETLFSVPVTGFVNSLQFSRDGKFLIAGIGQEHRLGRWWSLKQAKNSVCVIPLNVKFE